MPRGFFQCAVLFTLVLPLTLLGQSRGVIDDPDGFTNLRAEPDSKSAIVATVRRGEVFTFVSEHSDWYKVTLASGKKGYMHSSRIRFHATMKELADTKPTDEINIAARREGFDYYPVARAAAKGDPAAMQKYFAFIGDGAAGEEHWGIFCAVIHLLGDEKLAAFLRRQPRDYREQVRTLLTEPETLSPFDTATYLERCFPKTAAVLRR